MPTLNEVLLEMAARGEFVPGGVTVAEVFHDDDCDLWSGRACNCEPDFRVVRVDPPEDNP